MTFNLIWNVINSYIIYKLIFERHNKFERKNDDLYTNITITLLDALNGNHKLVLFDILVVLQIFIKKGFEIELEHLDKHVVKITREKITWPGAKIKKVGLFCIFSILLHLKILYFKERRRYAEL